MINPNIDSLHISSAVCRLRIDRQLDNYINFDSGCKKIRME